MEPVAFFFAFSWVLGQVKRSNHRLRRFGGSGDKKTQISEKFAKQLKKKTTTDILFIINSLKKHFIFWNLSESEMYPVYQRRWV
jgi:hypothetical protein